LAELFDQVGGLGAKLGPILVQLPPSLEFNPRVVRSFFSTLRDVHAGPVVCEPRHPSWFEPKADAVLVEYRVARVATDPARIAAASTPGGWSGEERTGGTPIVYYRLHGSPRTYWSRYPTARLQDWASELREHAARADAWCIFDNTASGAAAENALEMTALLQPDA
jgi:uncharacterized protein YecE (DUF72 family)